MRRERIKILINSVWSILDAEFEKTGGDILSLEATAREVQFRERIIETLENPTLKGKRLVREVESLVQELVRLKRNAASTQAHNPTVTT